MQSTDRRRLFPELRHSAEQQELVAGLILVAVVAVGGVGVGRWVGNPFAGFDRDVRALGSLIAQPANVDGASPSGGGSPDAVTARTAGTGIGTGAGSVAGEAAGAPEPDDVIGDFGAPERGSAGPAPSTTAADYSSAGPTVTAAKGAGFRFGSSADTTDTTATSPETTALRNAFEQINKDQLPLFAPDSTTLVGDARPVLNRVVDLLENYPDLTVEIAGHTDSFGAAEGNMRLSQSRANVVRDYLVARGIGTDRLIPRGYGETQPRATNDTSRGRAQNRRIEFRVLT
jgi:outer membrane protein OmpA-like peptidoglycan-associated protein